MLLGLLIAVAADTGASAAPPRETADFYGMNIQRSRLYDTQRYDQLGSTLASIGIGAARMDMYWPSMQPQEHVPVNFATVEQRVTALALDGIRVNPTLFSTTYWARDSACTSKYIAEDDKAKCPPDNPQEYANFAAAIAQRFGPGGSFWAENPALPYLPFKTFEVWNEPNLTWAWRPAPDPVAYGTLFRAVRNGLRAVDPSIKAIIGGVTPGGDMDGIVFLSQTGIPAAEIDGVGWHPYRASAQATVSHVADMRRYMDANGLATKPISLTEWGYASQEFPGDSSHSEPGLGEVERGQFLAGVASGLSRSDCGVAHIAPHTWDSGTATPTGWEDALGLAVESTTTSGFDLFPETVVMADAMVDRVTGDLSHDRSVTHYCERSAPDRDGDGVEDQHDYAPLDGAVSAQPVAGPPTVDDLPTVRTPLPARYFVTGNQARTNVGTFNGAPVPSFSVLRWEHCATDGTGCLPISGSASSSIPLTTDHLGRKVRSVVQAQNAHGTATATSPLSPLVQGVPHSTSAPTLSGTFKVQSTVTANKGTWKAFPGASYTYRFMHCASDWTLCLEAQEGTNHQLKLTAAHWQRKIKVIVTATNAFGSATREARSETVVTL